MIIISLNLKLFYHYLFIFQYRSRAKKKGIQTYNFKITNGKIKSHMRNQLFEEAVQIVAPKTTTTKKNAAHFYTRCLPARASNNS